METAGSAGRRCPAKKLLLQIPGIPGESGREQEACNDGVLPFARQSPVCGRQGGDTNASTLGRPPEQASYRANAGRRLSRRRWQRRLHIFSTRRAAMAGNTVRRIGRFRIRPVTLSRNSDISFCILITTKGDFMLRRKAIINTKECVACGCCIGVCPRNAITVPYGIFAEVNFDLCVGCGKCVRECPAGVITLEAAQ